MRRKNAECMPKLTQLMISLEWRMLQQVAELWPVKDSEHADGYLAGGKARCEAQPVSL